ncbi:MAG: hypothetical protein WA409_16450 [Candidatus Binatus sp.]
MPAEIAPPKSTGAALLVKVHPVIVKLPRALIAPPPAEETTRPLVKVRLVRLTLVRAAVVMICVVPPPLIEIPSAGPSIASWASVTFIVAAMAIVPFTLNSIMSSFNVPAAQVLPLGVAWVLAATTASSKLQ